MALPEQRPQLPDHRQTPTRPVRGYPPSDRRPGNRPGTGRPDHCPPRWSRLKDRPGSGLLRSGFTASRAARDSTAADALFIAVPATTRQQPG